MTRRQQLPNVTTGGIASHYPADIYRQIRHQEDRARQDTATTGQRPVIVLQAPPEPRSYVGPVLLILASTSGACALLFLLTELLKVTAAVALALKAAIPTVGLGSAVTLSVRRRK